MPPYTNVEIILEKSEKLHTQEPALSKQNTMKLRQRHKAWKQMLMVGDNRLSKQGTAFRTSDIKHVSKRICRRYLSAIIRKESASL